MSRTSRWRAYVRRTQYAEFAAGFDCGIGAGLVIAALVGALTAL